MASKRMTTKNCDPNQVAASGKIGKDQAGAIARTVVRPTVQAAFTLRECGGLYRNVELSGLLKALTEQTHASSAGDLKRAEAMLTAQAHTLDGIFNHLARCAVNAEYLDTLDRYLKLALRAQSQCRAAWETLATIKNPPYVGYVRQANIAHGPQQVNNASAASEGAPRGRKNPSLQNKLLEESDGERLDLGPACTSVQANPAMATLGEIDGTEVG